MTEANGKVQDDFMTELETAIRKIIKSSKASKADKLSAINSGTRLLIIKHRINGGDDDKKGFFDK